MQYFLSEIERRIKYFFSYCLLLVNQKKQELSVSVIIPVFNRAYIIHRALNSIYKQKFIDFKKIEIIVIDDGSVDNIDDVLALFPELIIIKKEHVGRIGLIRNEGLKRAGNEIIAYLDSDDYWLPLHLAILIDAFQRDPELYYVSTRSKCEIISIDDQGINVIKRKNPPYKSFPVTDCVAHKRECINGVGYFTDKEFAEDQEYWEKIKNKYKSKHIKTCTAVYTFTREGNNITYKFFPEKRIQ